MYRFETQEFDLTKEEQGKAKFIIETSSVKNKEGASGISTMGALEKAAFEEFKYHFYSDIRLRLHEFSSHIFGGNWSISDDGKKAICMKIIKGV